MIVRLNTHRLETLDQVQEFLAGSQQIDLEPPDPRRRLRRIRLSDEIMPSPTEGSSCVLQGG